MQPQSEPLHPLAQHLRYPLRILAPLESDDKIIAVAHQHRLASKARLHLALELRIPVKVISDSGLNVISESGQSGHRSERSDAGVGL